MRNVLTFISGVLLALVILFVAGVGATRYLIGRLSVPPEKPVFDNGSTPAAPVADTSASSPTASPSAAAPEPSPEESETPTTPSPSPSVEESNYSARVTQPIGLILRESPTQDSRQIAGLEYNTEVIVLEENQDGSWLRVQLPTSGVEGWIKAGNTEEIQ